MTSAASGTAEPPSGRGSRLLWAAAALGAVLIHAGALATFLVDRTADEATESGSPAIEIALDLASPRLEPTDLPAGPEADASAASAAVTEQTASIRDSELPNAPPTDAPDPDRLVAVQTKDAPQQDEPNQAPREANASQAAVAAEATAPPVSDVPREAPKPVAPMQGPGQSAVRERAQWQKQLVAHLDRNKRYPQGRVRPSSDVLVSFTLDRTGRVVTAAVARSSGEPAFDEAALAMLRRADPVPKPPPLVADEGLTFTVPVVFRSKGRG